MSIALTKKDWEAQPLAANHEVRPEIFSPADPRFLEVLTIIVSLSV